MKAAVYAGDRTVAVQERPVPVPSAGEVVIAVDYCGICGTDLHSVMEGWGRPGAILGQAALVTGGGPLGCLHAAALKAMGAGRVIVSEPSPARRDAACAAGADRVVAPEELDPPASPLVEPDDAVEVAFECSGKPAAFAAALAQLRPGGTLVIVGTGMLRPELDHHRVIVKELTVTGALNYDASGFDDALRLPAC